MLCKRVIHNSCLKRRIASEEVVLGNFCTVCYYKDMYPLPQHRGQRCKQIGCENTAIGSKPGDWELHAYNIHQTRKMRPGKWGDPILDVHTPSNSSGSYFSIHENFPSEKRGKHLLKKEEEVEEETSKSDRTPGGPSIHRGRSQPKLIRRSNKREVRRRSDNRPTRTALSRPSSAKRKPSSEQELRDAVSLHSESRSVDNKSSSAGMKKFVRSLLGLFLISLRWRQIAR